MTPPNETPRDFVRTRQGVEAVIMRIGLNTTQVILVAEDGEWLRYVVPTVERANDMCERLKIPFHEGYPDHLRRRVASHTRTRRDWIEAPYPERQRDSSV